MKFKTIDQLIQFLEKENDPEKIKSLYSTTEDLNEEDIDNIFAWRDGMLKDKTLQLFYYLKNDRPAYVSIETSLTSHLISGIDYLPNLKVESSQHERDIIIGGLACSALGVKSDLAQFEIFITTNLSENIGCALDLIFDTKRYLELLQNECCCCGYFLSETPIYKLIINWLENKTTELQIKYEAKHNRRYLRLDKWIDPTFRELFINEESYKQQIEDMVKVGFLDSKSKERTNSLSKETLSGIVKHWQKEGLLLTPSNLTNERFRRIIKKDFSIEVGKRLFDGAKEYKIRLVHKHLFPK